LRFGSKRPKTTLSLPWQAFTGTEVMENNHDTDCSIIELFFFANLSLSLDLDRESWHTDLKAEKMVMWVFGYESLTWKAWSMFQVLRTIKTLRYNDLIPFFFIFLSSLEFILFNYLIITSSSLMITISLYNY
jgi:hypothetical protein